MADVELIGDGPAVDVVVDSRKKRRNSYITYNENAGFRTEVVEYYKNNDGNAQVTMNKYKIPKATLYDWVTRDSKGLSIV